MKKLISIIGCVLALILCLTACGQSAASNEGGQSLKTGGVLILSVNPEIAIAYDMNGDVTSVTARNEDAIAVISRCTDLIGQPTREAVTDLVAAIGEAGYFVEEIEGERRQITLEIEPGSSMPNDAFLDDVIADIRGIVSEHDWTTPLVVEGESDFGISDYIDTDYGAGNDGVTDYDHKNDDPTDYGEGSDGATDYLGTDYSSDYNGATDDSDYGTTSGNTNYGDSAYGDSGYQQPVPTEPPATSGSTDYGDSQSDYHDGDSGYQQPAPTEPPATSGSTDYDDGQSDYDDGNSNYDDGQSNYDDSNTDYDDNSDYGDSDYE